MEVLLLGKGRGKGASFLVRNKFQSLNNTDLSPQSPRKVSGRVGGVSNGGLGVAPQGSTALHVRAVTPQWY